MTEQHSFDSAIYEGTVFHRRAAPKAHGFRYGVYSLLIDLDELPALSQQINGFSHNRWNLFSFNDRDHGNRDGTCLKEWCAQTLKDHGIELTSAKYRVLCFPRVLGYTFDPISVWFCYDGGTLAALIYEVHNTFGTDHSYVVDVRNQTSDILQHDRQKHLHVSPFFSTEGGYDFRIRPIDDQYHLNIRYYHHDGELRMVANHRAQRLPLTAKNLTRLFWRKPLVTAKVLMGIHWEALHLFTRKRARYHHPGPAPKTNSSADPMLRSNFGTHHVQNG